MTRRHGYWLIGVASATAASLLAWAAVAQADDFLVANTDDDGAGSLRQAIVAANANAGEADLVDATGVTGTIDLQSALPDLSDDVEIRGSGADQLTVRRDAGGDYRIFTIPASVEAHISGLTIANGVTPDNGGGISNEGTLFLNEVAVSGNTAENSAGGIYNLGVATIERTTVDGNVAVTNDGGGIANFHTMTIGNSTVAGNTAAEERGGGIVNNGDDLLTIGGSTIAGNTAASGPNLFQGSVGDPLPVMLTSTLFADPLGDPEGCSYGGNGAIDSQGYNLADDDSCSLDDPTDQPDADPQLLPLADYGGPTETMVPALASDAIDQGMSVPDGVGLDQRGLPRLYDFPEIPNASGGDAIDVGAVELQADDDFTAPDTEIRKGPKHKLHTEKRQVRVRFRFTGSDDFSAPGALTFECKLDRKPLRPCTSPFKPKVKPGRHRFRVFATDEVGNTDSTAARFRFKVKHED